MMDMSKPPKTELMFDANGHVIGERLLEGIETMLGAEVRAESDRECEELEAADIAEDEYLDALDTLGGASPSDRDDRSVERDQY